MIWLGGAMNSPGEGGGTERAPIHEFRCCTFQIFFFKKAVQRPKSTKGNESVHLDGWWHIRACFERRVETFPPVHCCFDGCATVLGAKYGHEGCEQDGLEGSTWVSSKDRKKNPVKSSVPPKHVRQSLLSYRELVWVQVIYWYTACPDDKKTGFGTLPKKWNKPKGRKEALEGRRNTLGISLVIAECFILSFCLHSCQHETVWRAARNTHLPYFHVEEEIWAISKSRDPFLLSG